MLAFAGMTRVTSSRPRIKCGVNSGEDLLFIYNDHLALAADLQNVSARSRHAKLQRRSGSTVPQATADNLAQGIRQGVAAVLLQAVNVNVPILDSDGMLELLGRQGNDIVRINRLEFWRF